MDSARSNQRYAMSSKKLPIAIENIVSLWIDKQT